MKMERNLYPWQEDCLKRWLSNGGRGMVQAATGTGKTRLALAAAARLQGEWKDKLKVKIVVPTGALMRQWNQSLREFLNADGEGDGEAAAMQGDIGMRGNGFQMPPDRKYMIYVINSARYELARQILSDLKKGFAVFLIADECHRYESGQNRLIFEFLPYIDAYRDRFFSLGLSATLPSGQEYAWLASVLGKKIYSYGMSRAVSMKSLCPYDIFHVSLSFEKEEADEYEEITEQMRLLYHRLLGDFPILRNMRQKEQFELLRTIAGRRDSGSAQRAERYMRLTFKRKSLVCLASARSACARELVGLLPSYEKILIFGERIDQAEELYLLLEERYPGKVGRYHSRMGLQAKQNTLSRFSSGEIRILITCRALDEGLNVPDASVGIVLSGTSMQRQRVQRLGRILRKKEGKDRASLYYLHVTGTAEDTCFLPDSGEGRIVELEYRSAVQRFVNPPYDRAAGQLLERFSEMGLQPEKQKELRRCLRLGSVRTDWLRERADIEAEVQRARYASDKNYWLCMKKLREAASTQKTL